MFETINERGVSLNAMDLLKNLLFVEVTENDYDKLKGKWEKITKPLDKAKLKPLRFLRYFIMANYPVGQDVVREDQIYEWFTTPSNIDDRKSVVSGKSVAVRVDLVGRRYIKKKK